MAPRRPVRQVLVYLAMREPEMQSFTPWEQ